MSTKAEVKDFYTSQPIAVVGVSRDSKKFGNTAYKELRAKGYKLYPVNPNTDTIEGDKCYPNLEALPEPVGGVLIILPPRKTEEVVKEANEAGIKRVWMQQGAESQAAIRYCEEHGMSAIHNECIMMYSHDAAFYHRAHKFVWGLLGKAPK